MEHLVEQCSNIETSFLLLTSSKVQILSLCANVYVRNLYFESEIISSVV